jgi:hypothetical protein
LIDEGTIASIFGSAEALDDVEVVDEGVEVEDDVDPVDAGGVLLALVAAPDVELLLLLPQPAIATTQTSGIRLFQVRIQVSSCGP